MPSIALVPVRAGDDIGGTRGRENGLGPVAAVCPIDGPAVDRDRGPAECIAC